jgi:signal peptidase II
MTVIPGALAFAYVENRNAAFGLGSVLPDAVKLWVLLGLQCVLSVVLLVLMTRTRDFASRLGFGVVVAGAIGNIIDRIRLGYVVDFIYWHGGFSWPNFNVADMLVCTGVGILIVFGGRHRKADVATTEPSAGSSGPV